MTFIAQFGTWILKNNFLPHVSCIEAGDDRLPLAAPAPGRVEESCGPPCRASHAIEMFFKMIATRFLVVSATPTA